MHDTADVSCSAGSAVRPATAYPPPLHRVSPRHNRGQRRGHTSLTQPSHAVSQSPNPIPSRSSETIKAFPSTNHFPPSRTPLLLPLFPLSPSFRRSRSIRGAISLQPTPPTPPPLPSPSNSHGVTGPGLPSGPSLGLAGEREILSCAARAAASTISRWYCSSRRRVSAACAGGDSGDCVVGGLDAEGGEVVMMGELAAEAVAGCEVGVSGFR